MTDIDYNQIEPDEEKDPSEYHYTERRAEILDAIERLGSPKRLPTKELAERYDVTRGQIYQDIDRLSTWVADRLGDRATARTQALYERVIDQKLQDDELMEAWRVTMEWNEWLADRGAIEKAPQKQEVQAEVTTREAANETETYALVEDTDESIEGTAALPADADAGAASDDEE